MRKVSGNKQPTKNQSVNNMGYYDRALPVDSPCAIYARQSTTKQLYENRESSELQKVELLQRAMQAGWKEELIILYVEGDGVKGVSGTKRIDQRPGLNALVERIYADEVKAVWVWDVSRLFRDEFQIQVNTYIQACHEHDVLTITPSYRYDFRRHPYDIEQFRREAEQAANFIKNHLKKTVFPAKERVTLDGRFNGSFIPIGYIVDRSDKQNKRYQVYAPHAKIIRWIFRRYRELDGRLYQLAKELDAMPYVFPAFDSSVTFHKTKLTPKNGGYTVTFSGLYTLLTNLKYLGWWYVGEMDEDGHRSGNPIKITSKDNHPAIMATDEELADFWYAFNRISPTDLEGNPIEREKQAVRYTQKDKPDSPALLKEVIEASNDRPAYVNAKNDGTYDYILMAIRTGMQRVDTCINTVTLDGVVVSRMMEWLKLFQRMANMKQTDIPQEVQNEIFPIGNEKSIYETFEGIRQEKSASPNSIDQQIEQTRKAIARAERDRQLASEEDYEQGIREAMRTLRGLNKTLEELLHIQASTASQEQDTVEWLMSLEQVLHRWNSLSLDKQKRFIRLTIERVIIESVAPRWMKIEIRWKAPLMSTDIGYLRRNGAVNTDWTEEEDELLRSMYPSGNADDIVACLPTRSWSAILNRAKKVHVLRRTRRAVSDSLLQQYSLSDLEVMREHGIADKQGMQWKTGVRLKDNVSSSLILLDSPLSSLDLPHI